MNTVKEISLKEAFNIHTQIPEFYEADSLDYFTKRLINIDALILGAKYDNSFGGYLIAYNKYEDGSIYCWMAGVIPSFRKSGLLGNMMKHLEVIAKDKGYKAIRITTRNTRREMLSYLVKNDFLFIEVIPYEPEQENRISLRKII